MTWSEALEASIKNWRKRANGQIIKEGCPLCTKDIKISRVGRCVHCPAGKTNICDVLFCDWSNVNILDKNFWDKRRKLAQKIVNALIKLRPKVCRSHKKK